MQALMAAKLRLDEAMSEAQRSGLGDADGDRTKGRRAVSPEAPARRPGRMAWSRPVVPRR